MPLTEEYRPAGPAQAILERPRAYPVTIYTPSARAPAGPIALIRTLFVHHDLIWQMTKREVVGRYKGSMIGLLWSFFNPLLLLGVYTFAFAYVLRTDIPNFALYSFSGLILVGLFNDVVTRAPTFILQNANYVKKVVFPLEVFPYVYLFSALIHAGMSAVVLLAGMLVFSHSIPLSALLVPLAIVPLALLILGFSWVLASLGVFLRDIAQAIGIVTMMLMYLSPVFYELDKIANPAVRAAVLFNPLTVPLLVFRDTVMYGRSPNWMWAGIYFLASVLIAWIGFYFFQRTKRGFPDVL